jgi:hypothetical protein
MKSQLKTISANRLIEEYGVSRTGQHFHMNGTEYVTGLDETGELIIGTSTGVNNILAITHKVTFDT